MINRKVLNHAGCTTDRLRAIFTATEGADHKIRKRFEDRIMSRVSDGMKTSMKNAPIWQAVDIAWDSTPIHKETIPMLLWAQGKIKQETLVQELQGTEIGKVCCRKGEDGSMKVDLPRLYEMSVNLIRSYVTRRLAAQTSRFSNIWPYFKYQPRGEDLVSKLRGDALSERIDEMADAYNYRHFWPQTFRHQFMYARSVAFVRSAWDQKINWRAKDLNLPTDKIELESYIEREGVDWVAPHITRVGWDRSSALANINTDTGPEYMFYWDIKPYRSIRDGDAYFNRDKVTCGDGFTELVRQYGSYFNYYFDPCVLAWPDNITMQFDPTVKNARVFGTYSSEDGDKGVLETQYFEKINPKRECIADLNVDVWIRLGVAGDNTVISGEFLTSRPACYGGLNENDDREVNASMATELMGFQDQLTNIFSQMLMNMRAGMLQIWAIDQDALEPPMVEHIKRTLQTKDFYTEPQAFFYSGSKLNELGVANPSQNPRAFLTIIQAQMQTKIQESLTAVNQVLMLADKLAMFSPNEGAQPNPREVAAREVTEISTSTDAIKTFVSDGIDEQRAAAKRIIAEALWCESTQTFRVPVMNRYTAKTVRDAGFELKGEHVDGEILPLKTPIYGNAQNLVYDFYYDSRDGGDRPLNSQGAQIMGTLLGQFMQVELIAKAFGKKRLFEWANEIVRMSGAAIDLKIEMEDNESDAITADDPALAERIDKIEQFLTMVMQKVGIPPPGTAPQGAPQGAPPPQLNAPAPEVDSAGPALEEEAPAALGMV